MKIKYKFCRDHLWFIADTHFYHENIIKYCNRPFENVEDMNDILITNWNSVVKSDDDVIVAGDFIHSGNLEKIQSIIHRLNGKIWLVWGNHCMQNKFERPAVIEMFDGRCYDNMDFQVEDSEVEDGFLKFHINHYPCEYWTRGAIHLHGHCISEDSEILTNNGWKNINTLLETDLIYSDYNNEIVLGKISNIIINNYSGYIYEADFKSVAFNVTDKHRMYNYNSKNKEQILLADEYFKGVSRKVKLSGKYKNVGIDWIDDLLRLYIYLAADGSVNKNTNLGRIKIKKEYKIIYVEALLNKLKLNYTKNKQKDNSYCFNFQMPKEFKNLNIKGLDNILLSCSEHQCNIILEVYKYSDGYQNGKGIIIYSSKECEIDLLQHLFVIHGYSTTKYERLHGYSKKLSYQLSVYKKSIIRLTTLKNNIIKSFVQNKKYWCIETTYGNFFTRLHGRVHLTGNCHSGPKSTSQEVCKFLPMRYDIGVDNNDYYPISYEQIKVTITKQLLGYE